jgi:predicted Zn-dependent protease
MQHYQRMRVARVAVAALSILAVAWFVLGARQAREISRATTIVGDPAVSAGQARQVDQMLDSAATLNPDRQVMLLRAALSIDRNHTARARRILEQVTRLEPDNLTAWDLLVQMGGNDIQLRVKAFKRLAQLEPPVPVHH